MFDHFNLFHPELSKPVQQLQAQIKKAFDFWVDVTIDTIKMYKAK